MTESKYEELVSALSDAGVALRDINSDYRSTYDIIKDIAAVWDDMSDMEQAALTSAVAGTRMQNIFTSLVTQFKEASGAMDAMSNSAGTFNDSYSKYLDSIEGRRAQLTATFQAFSQSVFDSSVIKGLISSLTKLLSVLDGFIKFGNGIPAKVLLITTLLKAIPLSTVTNLLGRLRVVTIIK